MSDYEKRGVNLAQELGILPLKKHEYLQAEEYYESTRVGTKARSNKRCEHCGKTIPMGEPHLVHKFYPEFQGYPTHTKCEEDFMKSLRDGTEKD